MWLFLADSELPPRSLGKYREVSRGVESLVRHRWIHNKILGS